MLLIRSNAQHSEALQLLAESWGVACEICQVMLVPSLQSTTAQTQRTLIGGDGEDQVQLVCCSDYAARDTCKKLNPCFQCKNTAHVTQCNNRVCALPCKVPTMNCKAHLELQAT
jgi:hypothetical protein